LSPLPAPANAKPAFASNFEFVGTIDNSPYLCVSTAIAYRTERLGGEDAIAGHLNALARQAGALVAEKLGTQVLENEEATLGNCAFSNVRLPLDAQELLKVPGAPGEAAIGGKVRDWMSLVIVKEYNTFMALMWYAGDWWVRLSAQVYLELKDFERAAEILKEVSMRVKKGEFLNNLEVPKL
jgi:hercynylcysteine S-oxide lyase